MGGLDPRPPTVNGGLAHRAGKAAVWQGVTVGGVKLIFVVRLLILARLLGPDAFGLLAISLVSLNVLVSLSNPGMTPALVQRDEVGDRHYDAGWTLVMGRGLLVALLAAGSAGEVARLFGEPRAALLIQVLALRPLLDSAASIRLADLTRELRFDRLAVLSLAVATVNAIVSIALAGPLGVWALVAGPLAGSVVYVGLSYALAPYRPRIWFDSEAMRALVRFGRWIWLNGVIVVLVDATLRLLISRRLGTPYVGLYFMAASLAVMPTDAVANVIGSVTFPVVARLKSDARRLAEVFRTGLLGTVALILPATALLIVLAPPLVRDVLGASWQGTASLIQVIAAAMLLGSFAEASEPLLKGMGVPRTLVLLTTLQSGVLLTTAFLLSAELGILGVGLAWIPAVIAVQPAAYLFVRRLLPRPLSSTLPQLVVTTLAAALASLTAWTMTRTFGGPAGLAGALLLAVGTYLVTMTVMDRRFDLGFSARLLRIFPVLAGILPEAGREQEVGN